MKWHVYKRDDPSTYPKIDCPILILLNDVTVVVCKWDNEQKCFYNDEFCFDDGCFYACIGYLPYMYQTHHPVGCNYDRLRLCPHGFDDDGYCICDDRFKCEHQVVRNEYEIMMRRVWKEFK